MKNIFKTSTNPEWCNKDGWLSKNGLSRGHKQEITLDLITIGINSGETLGGYYVVIKRYGKVIDFIACKKLNDARREFVKQILAHYKWENGNEDNA